MAKCISENKLAQKIRIKPSRLRLWRNDFLKIGGESKREQQGTSLRLDADAVFKIMVVVQIIKRGGSRIDAADRIANLDLFNQMGKLPAYLVRKTTWEAGSDGFEETSWEFSDDLPQFDDEDVSITIIDLHGIKRRAQRIIG